MSWWPFRRNTDGLDALIVFLQRMQSSFRKQGHDAAHSPEQRNECKLVADVLGDVIRYAAELRERS